MAADIEEGAGDVSGLVLMDRNQGKGAMSFFEVVVFWWSRWWSTFFLLKIIFPARKNSQKPERNFHTLSRAVGCKVVVFWWSWVHHRKGA